MHEVIRPLSVIFGPICPLVVTTTLHFISNEVANESALIVPTELTLTMFLTIKEGTFIHCAIRQEHLSFAHLLVISPVPFVD